MYTVHMSSAGNPDFGENPEAPLAPAESVTVETVEAASDVCKRYIRRHGLGGGNWTGGQVIDTEGRTVGHIAYNGRFFPA